MTNSLAERCRAFRVKARLTQSELARAAAVSRKTISLLESGDFTLRISLESLQRVADILGLELRLEPPTKPTLDDLLHSHSFQEPEAPSLRRVRKTHTEKGQGLPYVSDDDGEESALAP